MDNITILDCTFRDGGYYTDWNFSNDMVIDTIAAVSKTGVGIIEVGYKSPNSGGPLKTCLEDYICDLKLNTASSRLAFMIDLKEFVNKDLSLDTDILYATIPKASISAFDICRIATHVNKLGATLEAISCLQSLGYTVIVNLMGISLLTNSECKLAATSFNGTEIAALYFADSLGNLTPARTQHLAELLRENFDGPVGFHAHENQGLSLANTLGAIVGGATFIDATVFGMGRGAGNVRLEQLLLYLNSEAQAYDLNPLMPIIDKYLIPLKKTYKWGWSYDYMLTGQKDIHPMYAQALSQDYDLTSEQSRNVIMSLEFSDHDPSSKYSKQILNNAIQASAALELRSAVIIPARFDSTRFPGKPLIDILGTPMVIRVCLIAEIAVGKDNVFVATDSHKIASVVSDAGFTPIVTGAALTGSDRVAQAAKFVDADIIVNVQGDEPILDPNDIINIIENKKKCMHKIINGMCKLNKDDNPESNTIPKVVTTESGNLLYVSREPIPGWKSFDKKSERIYWKQVCIYAFTKNELELFSNSKQGDIEKSEDIEILRFLEIDYPVRMIETSGHSIAIDIPEDLARVERYLNENCIK